MSELPGGVFAASLTPLSRDWQIDASQMTNHCRWLLDNGCNGLVIFGTTGEANSFSVSERKMLLETLVRNGVPPGKLLVGTGCCALPDTITLTAHAIGLGVGGVLVLPPFYYKGVTDQGIFDALEHLVQQVADPGLKIYLYHIPPVSQVPFSLTLIEKLITAFPRIIVGIKDSSGDWEHMKSLRRHFPGLRVYAGSERFLLDILRIGGVGCISATTNLTSLLAAEVFRRRHSPEAEALQKTLTEIRKSLETFPVIPALKQLLAWKTGCDTWKYPRPPLIPLSEEQCKSLRRIADKMNLLKD